MRNIQILDCTLRDGGRIIDCAFTDEQTRRIALGLAKARVDIIEVGFLRDWRKVSYQGDSTFFTDVDQIAPLINKQNGAAYVAFVDYGMFDFDSLKPCDGTSIDGIRFGFTKKDLDNHYQEIKRCARLIQDKGYMLFLQGVNSLNYSDKELLGLLDFINELQPYSFGIVDTYGAMYIDDVQRLYYLIERNLDEDICIDFHSHNNFQQSFFFAQEVVKMSRGVRKVILDATLDGMGKGAGNLNTELIVHYLNTKHHYDYDLESILNNIDINISDFKAREQWGYSAASMMAGIYKSHPNNILYLLKKFRADTNDIRNILMRMDPLDRQRYDYGLLDKLCLEHRESKYDDSEDIRRLGAEFAGRQVLVIAPGRTAHTHRDDIAAYMERNHPLVVSVNHYTGLADYAFFANKLRFESEIDDHHTKVIVTSDIKAPVFATVSLSALCDGSREIAEISTLLLLNLLKIIGVREIAIAGMDGFSNERELNYIDNSMIIQRENLDYHDVNTRTTSLLQKFAKTVDGRIKLSFLTPSVHRKAIG